MTDLKQAAMQQALEALEGELLKMLDKPEDEQYRVRYAYLLRVITALREALAQPPLPVQEPTPWRDMVVVSLVREGINKHRARELADHFVNFTLPPPLPVQEPLEQLRPAEFIQLTKGKEAVTGIPAYCWSEWLNKEQP